MDLLINEKDDQNSKRRVNKSEVQRKSNLKNKYHSEIQKKTNLKNKYSSEKAIKPPIHKRPSAKSSAYGNMNRYKSHRQLSKNSSSNKNASSEKKVPKAPIRRVSSLAKNVQSEKRQSKEKPPIVHEQKKERQDYLSRKASKEKPKIERSEYSSHKKNIKERSSSKKSVKDINSSKKSNSKLKKIDSKKDLFNSKKKYIKPNPPQQNKSRRATPAKETRNI